MDKFSRKAFHSSSKKSVLFNRKSFFGKTSSPIVSHCKLEKARVGLTAKLR